MAGIEPLMSTDNLKTTVLKKHKAQYPPFVRYDPVFDALMISIVPLETETVVFYVDDHVGLLYTPDDLEIVGLQVEAFVRSFLPLHAEVQRVWKLSDTCDIDNTGDLILAVERQTPRVAREVAKAAEEVLGRPGRAFAEAIAS